MDYGLKWNLSAGRQASRDQSEHGLCINLTDSALALQVASDCAANDQRVV